jgi:lactoylglutathione lyase
MMFQTVDYVMIVVSDMKRSVEFYRDKIGLSLKFETPEWTEFNTGSTTVALHSGGAPDASDTAFQGKLAGTCSVGFNVKDVNKTYEEMQKRGVKFLMPPSERPGERIKLAVALDPDGLPISFAQNT